MVRILNIRWPITLCILLIITDMAISYIGVTYFGMVEGSRIINYYGIGLGVVLVFLLSLVIIYTLWRLRNTKLFSRAVLLAIWLLCFVELAAVINNLILMC